MFNSLKNQLAAFAVGAVMVTAGIIYTLSYFEEQRAEQQIYQERAQSQSGLVARMSANGTLRLSENLTQATRNQFLFDAVLSKNLNEIRRHAFTYENRLSASDIISGLRVVDRDGVILYSRSKDEIGKNIGLNIVQESMAQTLIKSGLEVYQGELQNHFAFPLTQRGKTFAAMHFFTKPDQVFTHLSRLTGAEHWVFTSPSGDVLAQSNDSEGLLALAKNKLGVLAQQAQVFEDKTFTVLGSVIRDYNGAELGYLTSFTDETRAYQQASNATMISWLAIFGWLMLSVIGTYLFVSFKLKPLEQMRKIAAEIEAHGDFSKRLTFVGKDEVAQSAIAINKVLSLVDKLVGDSNQVLEAVARGDFSKKLETQAFHGDLEHFAKGLNDSVESVRFTMVELERVVSSLYQGDLNVKMDSRVQGSIQHKMNELTDSLSQTFAEINQVMAGVKQSDFTKQIRVEAQGEVAILIGAINDSISNLARGFDEVISASDRISMGDFTQPMQGDYQFSLHQAQQAINQSMLDLGVTIQTVNQSVGDIVNALQNVADGTVSLDQRTHEQEASLGETRSAMSDTSLQVESNAKATEQANAIAHEQTRLLRDANASMSETQQAMQGIKAVSAQIQDITSLIDSISFQTNLLALNAAVEAARAGEHGRGFAVVAGEVRTLAGKSADAAKDIGALIDKAVQSVDQGVRKVDSVNGFLETITHETGKMQSLVSSITDSSAQQAQGVLEVNQSILQLDNITQQNADLVKQTRYAVEQMQSASNQLDEMMAKFKINSQTKLKLSHNRHS